MTYEEMKPSVKLRFRRRPICQICNDVIYPYESIEYIRFKNSRNYVQYAFFHTTCLCKKGVTNGEEE